MIREGLPGVRNPEPEPGTEPPTTAWDDAADVGAAKFIEAGFSRRRFALGGSPATVVPLGEVVVATADEAIAGAAVGSEGTGCEDADQCGAALGFGELGAADPAEDDAPPDMRCCAKRSSTTRDKYGFDATRAVQSSRSEPCGSCEAQIHTQALR